MAKKPKPPKKTPIERSKQTAEQILLDYFSHVAEPDMNAPIVSDPLRVAVAKFTSEMAEDFAGNDELIAKFLESHGLDVIADPKSSAGTRLDVAKLAAKIKDNIERKRETEVFHVRINAASIFEGDGKHGLIMSLGGKGDGAGQFLGGEWSPGTTPAMIAKIKKEVLGKRGDKK
jgi:hypothetical protein